VEGPRHYRARADAAYFDAQREQRGAYELAATPPDVQAEIEKLQRADFVVIQFPLWWWGPPAILKGWFDRVLIYGGLYGGGRRLERGPLAGRKAMLSVTLGASPAACEHNGFDGDTQLVLWPVLITLRYVGLSVLPPLLVPDVHGGRDPAASAALAARLDAAERELADRIAHIETLPELPFNTVEDFDTNYRLKPEARAYTPFIRHRAKLDLGS
jgi:NAD(P)H dehydrogenase (quinone)